MFITETNLLRRNNNFDLLRLFAALLVFLSHSFELRGIKENWIKSLIGSNYLLSELGLIIFFAMSGFLVCRSLYITQSAKQFLRNRFLRIWPALAVCTLIVFTAGIFLTTLPVGTYLTHSQSVQFLVRNLSALSSTLWLPGVFDGHPVNASVWTIPVEVRLYIIMLLVFLVTRLVFTQWMLIITVCSWLAMTIIPTDILYRFLKAHNILAIQQGLYFFAGACIYLYKDKIPFKFWIWLALLAYWIVLLIWFPAYVKKLQLPFFVYSVLWMAVKWPKISFFKADISYGFYLYAWPVQALIQTTMGAEMNFAVYVFVSAIGISIMALLSWYLVEKKALGYKKIASFNKSSPGLDLSQRPENKTNTEK